MITELDHQSVTVTGTTPLLELNQAQGVLLRSVTKRYGAIVAVENLTLNIPAGSYCCLLGPSGCGKTSTLRLIAGHEEITSGDVFIGTERVNDLPPAKRNTAMVFQNYALFPHKTVWQNVEFGLRMRGMVKGDRQQRVSEILDILGLAKFAHRKPHMLSGGQQQRVALARALVTRPKVLLLDEPLSALDENLRVKTRGELRKLQRQFGMTFIQVTHAQDEAYSLSDLIVVMDHGHIDQVGTPQEIFNNPASLFVAKFTGDNNIFTGKVVSVTPGDRTDVIELEVDGIGLIRSQGESAQVGTTAACCIRGDRLHLQPDYNSSTRTPGNQIAVRVNQIEFTGYVTRVSLILESTGTEIIYKVRTSDWLTHPLQEGQIVTLTWAIDECIFLPH